MTDIVKSRYYLETTPIRWGTFPRFSLFGRKENPKAPDPPPGRITAPETGEITPRFVSRKAIGEPAGRPKPAYPAQIYACWADNGSVPLVQSTSSRRLSIIATRSEMRSTRIARVAAIPASAAWSWRKATTATTTPDQGRLQGRTGKGRPARAEGKTNRVTTTRKLSPCENRSRSAFPVWLIRSICFLAEAQMIFLGW